MPPPPPVQRCFSVSATHEKEELKRGILRSEEGMHVATVKASTSLRMKNLGNVPPRLETL